MYMFWSKEMFKFRIFLILFIFSILYILFGIFYGMLIQALTILLNTSSLHDISYTKSNAWSILKSHTS